MGALRCIYDLATGVLIEAGPYDIPFDATSRGMILTQAIPDFRAERVENGQLRAATAQEITAFDTAQTTQAAQNRFDGEKLVKALAIWTAQKLNVPLATAKQEILTIYKGLP